MVITVGINGFGRIGRIVFRTCLESDALQVSAINDPSISVEYICYLIKFDSTHGKFRGSVSHSKDLVTVNGRPIRVFQEKTPSAIPWNQHNIKYVIEASGLFTSLEKASGHLQSKSVSLVLVTSPSTDIPMLVIGVNEATHLTSSDKKVVSCASSTLCCLALIMKLLDDNFGVDQGFVTSIHAMSPSLKPLDGLCTRGKNWRDHRSIHQNIIPASTGACRALAKIMPQFKDKLKALTFRVPIVNVSVLDLSIRLVKNTSLSNIVRHVDRAGQTTMKNLIRTSKEDTVSSDFIGDRCSCILDVQSSLQLKQNFYKLICWYENEYSYACRIVEAIMMSENYLQHRLLSSMSILRLPELNESNTRSRRHASDSSNEMLQNILLAQSKSICTTSSKVSSEIASKKASRLKLDQKYIKSFKVKTKDSMTSIINEMISDSKADDTQVKINYCHNIRRKQNSPTHNKEKNNDDYFKQFVRPGAKSKAFSLISTKKSPCSLKFKDCVDVKKGNSATNNKKTFQRCTSASATLQHSSKVSLENSSDKIVAKPPNTQDTAKLRRAEVINLKTSKFELNRNKMGSNKEITKCPCTVANIKSKDTIITNNFNVEAIRKMEDFFKTLNQTSQTAKNNKAEFDKVECNQLKNTHEDEIETNKKILLNTISSDMYLYFVDDKSSQEGKNNLDSKFDDKIEEDEYNIKSDYMPKECFLFGNNSLESDNIKEIECVENYLHEKLYKSDVGCVGDNTINVNKLIKDNLCEKLDSVSITDSENSFLVNGKHSQVLAISDVTVSIDDFQNLEQVCQIIEVSDELSDKLLSKLSTETNGDSKRFSTNWSFKDFCKKINLDEFCQELLGKIDSKK